MKEGWREKERNRTLYEGWINRRNKRKGEKKKESKSEKVKKREGKKEREKNYGS